MDIAGQDSSSKITPLQQWITTAWYGLCNPRLTGGLLIMMAVVLLLGLLIPQQTGQTGNAESWIATLPEWVQFWGEPLYFLGFGRLFQSLWWWLPMALLLLNSLLALAHYGPDSWRRIGDGRNLAPTIPPIAWQHPLARRAEHIIRLPKNPDELLDKLRVSLQESGFFFYQPLETEARLLGAVRRRWAWLSLLSLYTGLILLVAALLMSYYTLQTDRFTLTPLEPASSPLFRGQFELAEGVGPGYSQVTYLVDKTGLSQPLTWRLYWPAFLNQTLILPIAGEPVLTIQIQDAAGELQTLIPAIETLPRGERLNLPHSQSTEPFGFSVKPASLVIRMVPDPTTPDTYQMEIRRDSGTDPDPLTIQVGEVLELDDLSVITTFNHNLELVVYTDWAFPLYFIALLLLISGCIFTFARPPLQIWLIPEVKGLGGQLYGVVEKLGPIEPGRQFLEQLLEPKPDTSDEADKPDEETDSSSSPDPDPKN